ncbi:dynactin p62 family-domain-containing protein [Aspergillus multicolor]|uniref:putative dynactin Arp1 p62 subunit RO2 n=1 Tax=Aspergillus multicolor TaxID=41759 RepID=UPI003CCDBAEF
MACPFPYTFISCPCANAPVPDPSRNRRSRESPQKASPVKPRPQPVISDDEDEDEQTFDPRAPRSNFSLYPPEQLLYCEDCHQIKCPRCITEEILCWYCPSCLFETPSSLVRYEGNRCGRNCFNCPSCTAPLAVTALEGDPSGEHAGPWVLSCNYCMWTTLDIGIKFDKPTNIRAQLTKLTTDPSSAPPSRSHGSHGGSKSFGELKSPLSMYASIDEQLPPAGTKPDEEQSTSTSAPRTRDARFAALKTFYKDQMSATNTTSVDPTDIAGQFSSPASLQRLMSLYTRSSLSGIYGNSSKRGRAKPPVMREALTPAEGLSIPSNPDSETAIIRRLASDDCGWEGTVSIEQRTSLSQFSARFVEDLLPLPTLLRTKRSKRCKSCKHILVKPEFKPQSVRYRIKLIAISYIPLPTLRPLVLPPSSSQPVPPPAPDLNALPPQKPIQLLLTLKNHMFDPVRITLATPSVTPGRVASKVTILCPQFDIGANKDAWSEALEPVAPPYEKVAEAGKVWEKGRNWTTVVLEVVPGSLPGVGAKRSTAGFDSSSEDEAGNDSDDSGNDLMKVSGQLDWSGQASDPSQQIQPDEDVLEIPVFVRMEWDSDSPMETEEGGKDTLSAGAGLGAGVGTKRELAYWMVLGVGRIVSGGSASSSDSA